MNQFSVSVIKYRKIIIIISAVLLVMFGFFASKIKINSDTTTYLPKTDTIVKIFNHIGTEFGSNSLAMVIIESNEIFNKDIISQINLLTREFKQIDGVADVISLTNMIDIKKSEDGIEVGKLIEEFNLPQTEQELENLKNYVLSKEMYHGHIVSNDAKTTLIICRLSEGVDQTKTVRQIMAIANNAKFNGKIYFAGVPFQVREIYNFIVADLKMLIPIVGLLIMLLLFIGFRSISGVVIPLLSVLISIVMTLGIMSLVKIPLTIISNIIPVVLLTVGSAYSIHVINKFNEVRFVSMRRAQSDNNRQKALSEIIIPVVLAAATTIFGFISFVFGSYLTMIKEFGIFTSVGIVFALLFSITLVPALVIAFPRRKEKILKLNNNLPVRSSKTIDKFTSWILQKSKVVIGLTLIIAVVCIFGIPKIKRSSDMVGFFKPNSQIRISEQVMKNKFGGSVPIQILITGDILDPVVLSKMKEIEEFLKAQPGVFNPQSIVDLIEEMSYVIGEGRNIPNTRDKVANLWFLLEGEETVRQMVNSDKSEAIIQAMVSGIETAQGKKMIRDIQSFINNIDKTPHLLSLRQTSTNESVCDTLRNNNTIGAGLTGSPLIYERLDKSLMKSQVQSLIIAISLVFISLALMLGSFTGGLIGIVPILLTLLVIFGFMGYTKIPLDVATVLVGSISIGIGIDYSIHFLNRFRKETKSGKNIYDALNETLKTSGRAIIINVITVCGGFLVLVFANLIPLQRFGILVAITMVSSGLGALVILPAIMLITKKQ